MFSDDGGALQLGQMTGDAKSGYQVALTVRVDTGTPPTGAPPTGAPPTGAPPEG